MKLKLYAPHAAAAVMMGLAISSATAQQIYLEQRPEGVTVAPIAGVYNKPSPERSEESGSSSAIVNT